MHANGWKPPCPGWRAVHVGEEARLGAEVAIQRNTPRLSPHAPFGGHGGRFPAIERVFVGGSDRSEAARPEPVTWTLAAHRKPG